MILSIGMIVKNEEKYLEQCLSALKPLLEGVDSELIIADTGSTDNTVEIAKKFTDKVYRFQWVNDFSAARNFTLQKSKGEWYMFIDADEIAENCDGIINFFNSGEYKSYYSANYVQRSFTNIENGEVDTQNYTDFRAFRLVKRLKNVYFKGSIHEALTPTVTPTKFLDFTVLHYGYIFFSDGELTEQAKEKYDRNMSLLLKQESELKPGEEPPFGLYSEIAICYQTFREFDKSLEYLDLGLRTLDRGHIAINSYYVQKAKLLIYLKRFDELISLCDEYFGGKNLSRKTALASDIPMYDYRGQSCYFLEKYREAALDLSRFLELSRKYLDNKLNTQDLLFSPVRLPLEHIKEMVLMFFDSCKREGMYDTANKYLDIFSFSDFVNDRAFMSVFSLMKTEIMSQIGYDGLKDFYRGLDDGNQRQLLCRLRWELFEAEPNRRADMLGGLEAAVKGDPKAESAIDICKNYFLDGTVDPAKTESFLKKYGTAFNADILCFMLEKNIDITPFVTAEDFLANECVHAAYDAHGVFFTLLENYNIGAVSEKGSEKAAEMYKYALAYAASKRINITKLWKSYGEIGAKRRDKLKESDPPREISCSLAASRVASAYNDGNRDLFVSEAQSFLKSFPEFSPIVSFYRSTAEKEMREAEERSAAPAGALSEFEQMAAAVKSNIREMIKSGNLAAAESALYEYAALCPGDTETEILKEKINSLK